MLHNIKNRFGFIFKLIPHRSVQHTHKFENWQKVCVACVLVDWNLTKDYLDSTLRLPGLILKMWSPGKIFYYLNWFCVYCYHWYEQLDYELWARSCTFITLKALQCFFFFFLILVKTNQSYHQTWFLMNKVL